MYAKQRKPIGLPRRADINAGAFREAYDDDRGHRLRGNRFLKPVELPTTDIESAKQMVNELTIEDDKEEMSVIRGHQCDDVIYFDFRRTYNCNNKRWFLSNPLFRKVIRNIYCGCATPCYPDWG